MKNIIRLLGLLIAPFVVLMTVLAISGPANADDNSNEVSLTVTSTDYATASSSVDFTSSVRALIGGATQLSWEVPNGWYVRLSSRQVFHARWVTNTNCAAGTSSRIWALSHHAKIVRVHRGSCLNNEGRNGNIVGGFNWKLPYDAVLVYDSHIHKYRHARNIHGHSLSVECGNIIGGPVNVWYNNVVQVKSEADVVYNGNLTAVTNAKVAVNFNLVCPSGATFGVSSSADASGSASASYAFTSRNRTAVIAAHKATLIDQATANMKASTNVTSQAAAKIDIKANCGSNTPPPVVYNQPTVTATPQACVNPGKQDGVVTVVVGNPNNIDDTATVTVGSQTQSNISVSAGGTKTVMFYGYAPGTYSVSVMLKNAGKSTSTTVKVDECAVPPVTVQIGQKNDVSVSNTATVCADYNVPASLGSQTLKFTSKFGSYPGGSSFSVSGQSTLCTTYMAPSEVPSGGYDTLTAAIGSQSDATNPRINAKNDPANTPPV